MVMRQQARCRNTVLQAIVWFLEALGFVYVLWVVYGVYGSMGWSFEVRKVGARRCFEMQVSWAGGIRV